MSDLIHIISWERFCEKNNLNDLDKYAQFQMKRYPGLLDIRNLNTKQIGPLLQEFPENCLRILIEKSSLLLEHRNKSDSISGVDIIFKLLCLIARNNKNNNKLQESGIVDIVIRYMDLSMSQLVKEIDNDWLNLFEYLLYFLEIIYDPTFSWRRRKKLYYSETAQLEHDNQTIKPIQITKEIVMWMCTQLREFSDERDLKNRLLHLLCSILSGSKQNAQLLIAPAIVDIFTLTSNSNAETIASFCLLISSLSEISTAERQEDLTPTVTKFLTFIMDKSELRIHELRCLAELAEVNGELCEEIVRCDVFSVLKRYLTDATMNKECCGLCFVILSRITVGRCHAKQQFIMSRGYDRMLDMLTTHNLQSAFLLDLVFSWVVCCNFDASKVSTSQYIIRDGHVVGLLVRWGTSMAISCNHDGSVSQEADLSSEPPRAVVNWKAIFKLLMELCHKNRPSTNRCCQSGIVSVICDCIKAACKRMDESVPPVMDYADLALCKNVANSKRRCDDLLNGLFRLLEMFTSYSISGSDLTSIIRLFKDKHSRSKGRRVIKMLNVMVSDLNLNHEVNSWFELYRPGDHISILPTKEPVDSPIRPNLSSFQLDREAIPHKVLDSMAWKISAYSFSFHCWLNLSPVSVSEKVNSGHERSCIFRLLTENHNGFEAFLNMDGQLLVATCHQGEFHYVQVTSKNTTKKPSFFIEENLLKLDKWQMLDLVFQNARNFFGKSTVTVYIDGVLVNTLDLKYPLISENISVFHIGGCSKTLPTALTSDVKSRKKAGFLSNSAIKRTWLGEEHNVWGRLSSLKCRLVSVACLNEALTEQSIGTLHSKGPMNSHAIYGDDQLNGNIIVNFHALAFDPVNNQCSNLHPYIQSSKTNQFHCGLLTGEQLSCLKLEVAINEIGGMSALLPIIEQLDFLQLSSNDDFDNEDGYRFDDAYRFEDTAPSTFVDRMLSSNGGEERFITVPDNTSDQQLDGSAMASIVILLRKMTTFDINQKHMERSKCFAIIGAFMQKVETIFLDMNVVIAFHALADQNRADISGNIYRLILLDWRIWSRCSIDTRHRHCVFIANLVKHERSHFRSQYGVGFFLDVIRCYHEPYISNGSDENQKLRQCIYDMIFSIVHKHVNIKDYQKMVKFVHECNNDLLMQEMIDFFIKLFESSSKGDQDSLLIYESKLMESLFVLLIRDLSIETKEKTIQFMHLIITSPRVPDRHKDHLLLTNISFASIFNYKEFCDSPISCHSINKLLEILRKAAPKDLFGVVQFLSLLALSPLEEKISAMRMLKSFFDKSPEALSAISQQPGWQDILIHILVTKRREEEADNSPTNQMVKSEEVQHRNKDENANIRAFRRSSTWILDESLCENNGSSKLKFDEILEEDEDFSLSNVEINVDDSPEVKSIDAVFLRMKSNDNSDNTVMTDENSGYFQQRSMCGSFSGSDDAAHLSKHPETSSDPDSKESADPTLYSLEEQLIDLTLQSLHMVVWSVLSSANNELAWMIVHQIMESLRSVNERYVMLKPMFYLKQRMLVGLLKSTIDLYRSNDIVSQQNSMHTKELVRLIVDSSYLISTETNYQYEPELLDLTIVLLQDYLEVWEEETLYPDLAALGFYYLLTLSCSQDLDIVSAVCARLHHIITTLSKNITYDEIAFILVHLDRVLKRVIHSENYYFITPILRTLLEQHMDMLQISMYLANLSIKTADFYDYFKEYCGQLEWRTFIKTRLCSACEIYESSYLNSMTTEQSLWRAQANEQMSLDRNRRAVVSLELKKQFESEILNLTKTWIKEERRRKEQRANELTTQHEMVLKQWRVVKQFLNSSKGCWQEEEGTSPIHLKQSCRENYLRMRPRFEINHQFDSHTDASMERDHPRRAPKEIEPDPLKCLSALEGKIDFSALGDDQLGDDEWISIQNMEQADNSHTATNSPKQLSNQKKSIFESRCKLVTFTEVIDGKFEMTSSHLVFQGQKVSLESLDLNTTKIMCSINQIREVHLRRYNLRRSAIEIFLTDQTNYFFNFDTKVRDTVYSKILSLRPPNLVYSKQRCPADLLKSSNLTQKWVNREISNFEYLMQLNTIAGRTYNDMSQYHVFPWIIADYTSPKLDLNNPKSFRDLSKPIGVVNPKNENEVREKYEGFEDPSGVIAKFHYGTHYSSAAGVMHYMVRMEPFTTMHIQLQSGKFDVADRQFHSIPLAWSFIMESPNDNKELIPEFFYQPQFLKNDNNFDFGLLQQTKTGINDVELPAWASSPEDFIYQHRQALESEHVSMNLHHWIDLIFGYKQKGSNAVKALNVFYYVTYEGVVDLDLIEDRFERESIESMINNFGQTPCQLLKHRHPQRLSSEEIRSHMIKVDKYLPVMLNYGRLKHSSKYICSASEPITFVRVPLAQTRSIMGADRSFNMVTVHSSNIVARHTWTPNNKGSAAGYDIDSVFDSPSARRRNHLGNLSSLVSSNNQLYAVSPDSKFVIAGGDIENRLTVMPLAKRTEATYHGTWHHLPISCVALDIDSVAPPTVATVTLSGMVSSASAGVRLVGISGSLDSTCVLWDWSDLPAVAVLQVLHGHHAAVASVSLSVFMDVAVSGGRDGTVNLHSVSKGQFLHTIVPGGLSSAHLSVNFVLLNRLGHVIVQWQRALSACSGGGSDRRPEPTSSGPCQHLSLYSLHANHFATLDLEHSPVSVVHVAPRSCGSLDTCVLVGNAKGQLKILDGYDLTEMNMLAFKEPIRDAVVSCHGQFLMVALSSGQLIMSSVEL